MWEHKQSDNKATKLKYGGGTSHDQPKEGDKLDFLMSCASCRKQLHAPFSSHLVASSLASNIYTTNFKTHLSFACRYTILGVIKSLGDIL